MPMATAAYFALDDLRVWTFGKWRVGKVVGIFMVIFLFKLRMHGAASTRDATAACLLG
jgi:hypothetical protein